MVSQKQGRILIGSMLTFVFIFSFLSLWLRLTPGNPSPIIPALVKKEPSFAPYLWYLLSFKKEALVPDYTLLKKQINIFIAPKDSYFGIYFRDLTSGQEFGINENVPLIAASTVKLPLVLYINTLVNKGKLNWDDKIAYQEAVDYEEGSGILRYTARNGELYSVRTLATLAIVISDNIAYRMLVKHAGKETLIDFMKYSGGQTVFPGGKNLTTARDMSVYVQATLDFVKKDPKNGKRLLDDLAHSIYHVGLPGQIPAQI
ncbi:MAG TPA: hypothetical protein DCK87_00665, partial [Desulfotomaculum sp.]|nr:hypothetical protein [Desulfotomaculum sp.]